MKIDEIIQQFELGMIKSVACLVDSAFSFLASSNTEGLTSGAAGVTGWALAISTIVVLAKTCKHLYERSEKKDAEFLELLEQKNKHIEDLHAKRHAEAKEE